MSLYGPDFSTSVPYKIRWLDQSVEQDGSYLLFLSKLHRTYVFSEADGKFSLTFNTSYLLSPT